MSLASKNIIRNIIFEALTYKQTLPILNKLPITTENLDKYQRFFGIYLGLLKAAKIIAKDLP